MDAPSLARQLVEPLGRRWLHVRAVAERAETLGAALLDDPDRLLVAAAAWLHDVGYAKSLVRTALHPLDGATYLAALGDIDDQVIRLVAHHTGALVEAEERGLADELLAFPLPRTDLLDIVTTADMVTGPGGAWVRAEDRINEILTRYSPGTPVHRAVSRSGPDLLAAVARVEEHLAAADAAPAQPT